MLIVEDIKVLIEEEKDKKFYEKFNPIIGETIIITTLDLPKKSKDVIKFNCDLCQTICETSYRQYNIKIRTISSVPELQGMALCRKCGQIKAKQTIMNKYGVSSYALTSEYKDAMKKRFGVDNISQLQEVKDKIKNTNIEKYGVSCYFNSNEYKNKIGTDNISQLQEIKDKKKLKAIEKYGVVNVFQSEIIKEKIKITNNKKYGVNYPTQNKEIFEKTQAAAYKKIKYKDTDIFYQGTYELDFIEYCIINNIIFERGITIDYILNNKNRKYHSDFYIPEYNLICEVKSTYTFNDDYLENLAKKDYTIKSGYNFLFIIDKNYSDLEQFINSYII